MMTRKASQVLRWTFYYEQAFSSRTVFPEIGVTPYTLPLFPEP
jgi:hypothetical protein